VQQMTAPILFIILPVILSIYYKLIERVPYKNENRVALCIVYWSLDLQFVGWNLHLLM
jgi:Sec-independent protein secretion pathway component TatC